jgi:hypothetical protein
MSPDIWRSLACPRRRSCVLCSAAPGTLSTASIVLRAAKAVPADTPGNNLAPGSVLAKSSPSTCTGHVSRHSLHQHPRTSRLPLGLFLRRSSVKTK